MSWALQAAGESLWAAGECWRMGTRQYQCPAPRVPRGSLRAGGTGCHALLRSTWHHHPAWTFGEHGEGTGPACPLLERSLDKPSSQKALGFVLGPQESGHRSPGSSCSPFTRTDQGKDICFILFLGPHPQHMEVPRLGVESERQPLAYSTATAAPDPSHVCDLHGSSQQ